MLRKFSRSLERKRDGKVPMKFRFDVHVTKVNGAFSNAEQLRVVWTRGAKVQVTPSSSITSGSAHFDATLSQIATMYKDSKNRFEEKEYVFKVQTVGLDKSGKVYTIGKAVLDMSQYASVETVDRTVILPITSANPQVAKGIELHFKISSTLLKGLATDDGLSGVSGLSAVTSNSFCESSPEQDLTGFDPLVYRCNSGKIGTLPAAVSTELCKSLSQESDKTDVMSSNGSIPTEVAVLQGKIKELEMNLHKEQNEKEETTRLMETFKRQSENDIQFLKKELEYEKAQKSELETQLVKEMDEATGEIEIEEAIQCAIAPYELRCNALEEDYKQIVHQSSTEIDNLQEELLDLRDHVSKLENLLEANERARETLQKEKHDLELSLIGTCSEHVDMDKERRELRQELTQVDDLMQELIQTKMNYAELSEKHTISRREACKLKEKNLQLASKLTKIETYLYYQQKSS